jgi:hypothetical protein
MLRIWETEVINLIAKLMSTTLFFNPHLFASCTNTFSKCCEITRGMKKSAQ